MLILGGNQLAGGYEVSNSVRMDGTADYFNYTFGTSTNVRKRTINFWVKRSKIDDSGGQVVIRYNSSGAGGDLSFLGSGSGVGSNDQLFISNRNATSGGADYGVRTNRLFRDVSAWYNIHIEYDTTQSTASDRIKIYVNGVQETSLAQTDYPSLNYDSTAFLGGTTAAHEIGRGAPTGLMNYFSGYFSNFVFVDGTALDPTSFGEFDADTGIWKPIDVSGLTFGNEGFYLPFENSAALGQDDSGNGNNFTVNNLTSIDQTTDTPTNNYCTMNPLDNYYTGATFSEGNLKVVSTNGNRGWNTGTIGVSQGKWYWEIKYVASGGSTPSDQWNYIGITDRSPSASTDILGYNNYQYSVFEYDGKVYASSSTPTTYGATFNTGDIVQIALDLDNNNIYWGLNGQWGNGSGSWNQSSPSSAISVQDPTGTLNGNYFPAFGDGGVNVAKTWQANFGNPPFTISSGNSDGNGYGNFEYSVPSGYYALNTKNLAEYG